ncbi:MAG: TetR/AcrR family transcriptional regulator [Bradyrhizobiaceae bacterium]|nr:TetR/AcrR family transcriptional regulator [Bradyrhizobiaceae bacterium]
MNAHALTTRAGNVRAKTGHNHIDNAKVRQILGAARKVFMELGYGAASMDAIARQAAVSKATLYAHFAGKDALFEALIVMECKHLSEQIGCRVLDEPDIRVALRSLAQDFNNLLCQDQSLAMFRIVVAEAPRFPELGRIFYDSGPKIMIDRLAELLAGAAKRGLLNVGDARIAAVQFMSLVRGDSQLKRVLGRKPAAKHIAADYVDSSVELFLAGYGSRTRSTTGGGTR